MAVGMAAASALAAGPAAAQAAPSAPSAGLLPATCVTAPISGECNTAAVQAGSDGAVYFNVNTGIVAPCHYYIRDVTNGRPVRDGSVVGSYAGRVTGLTNWYRLELRFCFVGGATGAIY
ncbi:hypothetical protein [Jidongwangia harbinensis]|uniref:hypothetical protein n=1 Tax=Jidongwangia harbinensis TaxID=2878561 RepID=UPI001CD98F13|nr:hypothetical protein [Jidongwangia harbinensis]MCA2211577.1 hypothetical protein [Jidongwangia harbinensis]